MYYSFTRVLTLVGCLGFIGAQAQSSGRTPFMQKSFPRESVHSVESVTSGGNISVSGLATGEARVEVYVTGNNNRDELSREEIQKRLTDEYDLNVSLVGNKLMATARGKDHNMNWRKTLNISFRIYVPQTTSSLVKTSGGNINMKDLSGTEEFKTSGGNLDIDHLSGKMNGRTSGGNVSVADSKDDIDLATSGGNIEAEHCEGTMRLVTSGGNVKLKALTGTVHATTSGGEVTGEAIGGELQTHTSGGNINVRDLACSLKAGTSGGSIDVTVKTLGKYVDLENSSGNINLELPDGQGLDMKVYGERVHTSTLHDFAGQSDEKHIVGAIKGGGVPVTIDGNSGNVRLSFR